MSVTLQSIMYWRKKEKTQFKACCEDAVSKFRTHHRCKLKKETIRIKKHYLKSNVMICHCRQFISSSHNMAESVLKAQGDV